VGKLIDINFLFIKIFIKMKFYTLLIIFEIFTAVKGEQRGHYYFENHVTINVKRFEKLIEIQAEGMPLQITDVEIIVNLNQGEYVEIYFYDYKSKSYDEYIQMANAEEHKSIIENGKLDETIIIYKLPKLYCSKHAEVCNAFEESIDTFYFTYKIGGVFSTFKKKMKNLTNSVWCTYAKKLKQQFQKMLIKPPMINDFNILAERIYFHYNLIPIYQQFTNQIKELLVLTPQLITDIIIGDYILIDNAILTADYLAYFHMLDRDKFKEIIAETMSNIQKINPYVANGKFYFVPKQEQLFEEVRETYKENFKSSIFESLTRKWLDITWGGNENLKINTRKEKLLILFAYEQLTKFILVEIFDSKNKMTFDRNKDKLYELLVEIIDNVVFCKSKVSVTLEDLYHAEEQSQWGLFGNLSDVWENSFRKAIYLLHNLEALDKYISFNLLRIMKKHLRKNLRI
jgi:hypothetical protein